METPLDHFFNDRIEPESFDALTRGPLAVHLKAYAQQLYDQGYAVRRAGCNSACLGTSTLAAEQRTRRRANRFVDSGTIRRCRIKAGKLRTGDTAALARLWRMLRPSEVEMTSSPPIACQIALREFQHYLRQERGLSEATITRQTPVISALLAECFPTEIPDFHQISASDIAGFVQRQAERITAKSAPTVVTALRSFFRHLLHRGAIDTDMAVCVPTIATWSLSGVPKSFPPSKSNVSWTPAIGIPRLAGGNYAILLLLAQLGLRAGEVVALRLDDIDWEAGLITIRGKRKRVAQMPLPVEAGTAMADYLRQARPDCSSRSVFIRGKAPLVGFANSIAICSLVDRALERAGVESAYRGSHLFRHSLATEMLKQGASLPRLAICCAIGVRTQPQSTPRST